MSVSLPIRLPARTGRRAVFRLPRAAALACALILGSCGRESPRSPELPPVRIEELTLDLKAAFDAGQARVLAQDETWPLATWPAAWLDRSEALGTLASDASASVLHARAESAFEIDTPVLGSHAHLLARTFVYPVDRNDPQRADPFPVTFRILVDGQERASLSSSYVRETEREHPFDRLMRTLEVDLSAEAGRSVCLRLETTRGGHPAPGPGEAQAEPSWWDLSLSELREVPRQVVSRSRPHLLVVCVDTLAAGRMSAFGYARQTTPAIARWAASGLSFTRAISASSWTLPATASLFTGLPANTHGVLGDARSYLMDGLATWAEGLERKGLLGAAFVANPLLARANHYDQGFSSWVNDDGQSGAGSADADQMLEHLLEWIDAQPGGGRWFAYLHLMDPHAPYGAPGAARERFTHGYEERRDFGGHLPGLLQRGKTEPFLPDQQAHVADLYDGEVAYVDEQFGRLLEALAARGLDDRTLVVLCADHGEELFEYGSLGHGYALCEPMLHVPLVLAGPGVPPGVVTLPVSTASLANTLLRLGGAPTLPGAAPSLLPPPREAGVVFSLTRTALFGPRRVLVSARDGEQRKVVLQVAEAGEHADRQASAAQTWYYDLSRQRPEAASLELDALRAEQAAGYRALARAALDWYTRTAAARPDDVQQEVDLSEALRKVGYLGDDRR